MVPHIDAMLVAATVLLAADSVPKFNVEPFCRRMAQLAEPVGDVNVCLQKEQEAREELGRQWRQFAAADKSYCVRLHTIGTEPTYTEVLSCLELQRELRRLRQKQKRG
jgi:hypothetical protein